MTYIYDLILNFNKEIYEFFEWKKDDNYLHIKKIPLIKIDSKSLNDIFDNKVHFNNIEDKIYNNTEYYNKKVLEKIPYSALLTDSYRILGIILDNNLNIIKYSKLDIEDEEMVLDISSRLPNIFLEYNILDSNIKTNLTRYEQNILEYLKKEINNINDYSKIKYLYYEYFLKEENDINIMKNKLINSLNNYSNKHLDLYNVIKQR